MGRLLAEILLYPIELLSFTLRSNWWSSSSRFKNLLQTFLAFFAYDYPGKDRERQRSKPADTRRL